ncbi:MAG: L-threonylcarbamoyladenylate synthase, partial [Actinomycetota bacterium]|nr:L-threonylcarbamoyladenylate synthase [Actinomycetota bacterium]
MTGPLEDAVEALARGELVIFPTDTVYGLAARPDEPSATARLFEAKRRPQTLTLPVLVGSIAQARTVARFDER